ncbi:MAG TPA: Mur ligase family protein [Verrucomicrobiae bacterium]|nr:Mur ligase family protein [Verrucomicrobiae bacterium]
MLLSQIIKDVPLVALEGSLKCEVAGLAHDCRRVRPGMIYVDLPKGGRGCEEEAINAALDRGAAAVICERNGFMPRRATKIVVRNCREALARAAAEFHSHPSRRLRVIGVTGSGNRAVIAFMLKRLLEAGGMRVGIVTSTMHEVADRQLPVPRQGPEALEVQQLLAQMVRAGCEVCVMEVGSAPLDAERTRGVEFHALVSVQSPCFPDPYFASGAHAGTNFGTLELAPGGTRIQVSLEPGTRGRDCGCPAITIARDNGMPVTLRATMVDLNSRGTRLSIDAQGRKFVCTLPLWGRANVQSAIVATGVALALGVPAGDVRPALQRITPAPGQLEAVTAGQPFMVFVDGARDATALQSVLMNLRDLVPGRVLLALGSRGGEDGERRFHLGQTAAAHADCTLVTTDSPRRESPSLIAGQIAAGYRALRVDGYGEEPERERAIERLLRAAEPGDAVLIAGKGHETFQEFADTVVPFDDAGHAREILEGLGYGKGINRYELRAASINQIRARNAELAACNT